MNRRKFLEYWWVLPVGATFGALGWMAQYAYRVTVNKQKVGTPQFVPHTKQRIGQVSKVSQPYQSLEFNYNGTPCILMCIPQKTQSSISQGSLNWVAFSRVCTHLGCLVGAEKDPEAVAFSYNYRPEHPILGCPCHFSVFDPLQDGESVFGKALYPLPRVQLKLQGDEIYAVGMEPAPKT